MNEDSKIVIEGAQVTRHCMSDINSICRVKGAQVVQNGQ